MPNTREYCSQKVNYCYTSEAKDGGLYIEPSYNMEFLQVLKDHIPKEHRRWEPDLRRWYISPQYRRQAMIDVKVFFGKVIET
ncbi:hypothetical protein [Phosphitispora fastidiosa]|uniref:hypothetical protein n=1 Tax=Phosphitispora fastidiosa TaxID=2837202 RepID=UPI001E443B06|nr:hypothetical protein [Phosphitispora fastidiosa]MBU7006339.1 hypothetical protein [Phosphitispora fastidiosa]